MSAAASLGAIMLWDVEGGLALIDKYLYSQEDAVQAGALLAIGLVSIGVRNESDPALALLSEKVNCDKEILRIASIVGYLIFLIQSWSCLCWFESTRSSRVVTSLNLRFNRYNGNFLSCSNVAWISILWFL